jgi:hypothetical protein
MPVRTAEAVVALSGFLQHVLRQHDNHVLIVCSTREEFLHQVLTESCRICTEEDVRHELVDCNTEHSQLLKPTLHLLSQAQNIKLVFTPSIMHLRAALADIERYVQAVTLPAAGGGANVRRRLYILSALAIHEPSGEFSAQGLSRTFALAVDAAHKVSVDLGLVEICRSQAVTDGNIRETTGETLVDPWSIELPLLNGSTRSTTGAHIWAGRTVPFVRVVKTWFKLENRNEDIPI